MPYDVLLTLGGVSRDQVPRNSRAILERVDVPEWGGHVHVRYLARRDLADLSELLGSLCPFAGNTSPRQLAAWCMVGVCDEHGDRLTADAFSRLLTACTGLLA